MGVAPNDLLDVFIYSCEEDPSGSEVHIALGPY